MRRFSRFRLPGGGRTTTHSSRKILVAHRLLQPGKIVAGARSSNRRTRSGPPPDRSPRSSHPPRSAEKRGLCDYHSGTRQAWLLGPIVDGAGIRDVVPLAALYSADVQRAPRWLLGGVGALLRLAGVGPTVGLAHRLAAEVHAARAARQRAHDGQNDPPARGASSERASSVLP
jgi:hypothetical protein